MKCVKEILNDHLECGCIIKLTFFLLDIPTPKGMYILLLIELYDIKNYAGDVL